MNPNFVRDIGAQMEVQLATFEPKKRQGTTVIVVALEEDLSFLSPLPHVPLVTDTKVPLAPIRSPKC